MSHPYENYEYTEPHTLEVEIVFKKKTTVRAFDKKHALEIIERRLKKTSGFKKSGVGVSGHGYCGRLKFFGKINSSLWFATKHTSFYC